LNPGPPELGVLTAWLQQRSYSASLITYSHPNYHDCTRMKQKQIKNIKYKVRLLEKKHDILELPRTEAVTVLLPHSSTSFQIVILT
jgi:hypothetical protein